ncbi:helix-hairpin-helix domain-containing protein [Bacillus luteolus]|uniref:Helix-hairpin-helix domain-containing protein n=1 Tax=Litchfieldia luteola TaxID=682179 RepID=A0ABR9QHR8_9BACI|nr:helix-hairpin-helix domain-containing protein [Cytobacillus luteolus]MBE4908050.1 helix-hairpin-helix domain-containing protein [Cytobacillus luteolus]MBP1942833.1 competence protein ComEA [Cytobacillus luteolus]
MKEIIIKYKYFMIIGLGLLVVSSLYYFTPPSNDSSNELIMNEALLRKGELASRNEAVDPPVEKIELSTVYVDVKGAVVRPGVYELKNGSRVKDALELAGGVNPEAEVNNVNLAELLVDEMVIYVPKVGEEINEPNETLTGSSKKNDDLISINKATIEELQTLPGIGPSKAAAIIEYREQNGGFATIDEILSITGIGPKTLEKFRDKITLK